MFTSKSKFTMIITAPKFGNLLNTSEFVNSEELLQLNLVTSHYGELWLYITVNIIFKGLEGHTYGNL